MQHQKDDTILLDENRGLFPNFKNKADEENVLFSSSAFVFFLSFYGNVAYFKSYFQLNISSNICIALKNHPLFLED